MKYRVQNIVNNEYLDDDVIFLLPNGEVGWFIRDGSYPHYRKFGHQEDFKVINEDCEKLKKQLDIAKRAMNKAYKQIDVVDRLGALHTLKRAWDRIEELK